MMKFYAYYQENYGEEKFELRDHEEKIIVIAAPSEGDARAAFVRIIDEQIRAIGNAPEENDLDFIIADFSEEMRESAYYNDYEYDEV